MSIQLSDASLLINNEVVPYVPNTLAFTEGFGEQTVRAAVIGNGKVEQVYSRNAETAVGRVKFELHTTPDNVKLARQWKSRGNRNVVQIVGITDDGEEITRTFSASAVTNDYEVQIGSETTIEIEIMGNQPA